jgi:nucleoid DNA-binding protein
MDKRSIVEAISEELGLPRPQIREVVQQTLDGVVAALAEDGRAELRNFGVFAVRRRKPRKARNPRTGEKVMVPEKLVVVFKAGRVMQERVEQESRRAVDVDGAAKDGSRGRPP